jgi:hypothetical protein
MDNFDLRKYLAEGKLLKEFRRTGRQYKAQGQGGSAGNRRPGIMRGPDIEDRDDEEYTSKGDPNIDKGDFYDYSPYGFTIRFLGYEDGDDVIVRGNGFFSEKVKNGKVTFKSYPMKDAQGNRLEDAQGNRPGTPNSTYKLSDNYNINNIEDVLGNDHPFVVMTKSNHWKNNHSIDIDDNSISITLDTPNNLPSGLAPLSDRFSEGKIHEITQSGQEGVYPMSEEPGDMFQQKEVEELFPIGMASRDDKSFKDKLAQHGEWTEESMYNNTFVHFQYHELDDVNGNSYHIHQGQHYNHNYDDFRSPKFTVLTIIKNYGTPDEERLGEYIVGTGEYLDDIKNMEAQGIDIKRG